MQNLSKIDTAKDLVTKEWVEAQDFLPSEAFTKNGIKNALGIADWALAASKPSYDDVYLKLAGGTINGNLTVSGQFKSQTSLASVSLLSNIFDVNASLKVQPGWNLYLNGEAIMKWSDLKSKIAYSFSEISSKPTTLEGYGITDAYTKTNADATFLKLTGGTIMGDVNVTGMMYSKNYPQGGTLSQNPSSAFISTIFGTDAVNDGTYRQKVMRAGGSAYDRICHSYSPMLTIKTSDTHAYISIGYNAAGKDKCYIGAGISGAVSWSGKLFHDNMDLIPKDDGVFYLGYSDKRWRTLNVVNITADGIYGNVPKGGTYQRYRLISGDDRMYLQVGAQDGTATTGKLTISGINVAVLLSLAIYSQQTSFSGAVQVAGGITLGGRTISNWDQVKMEAAQLLTTTGSQSLSPNMHYNFPNTLTSSSNISFTLTDDTSGESITRIYYIVFRTGATTPTFTFNRTLYWKDGKGLTTLAANKRYRIVIDDNLATLETYS